MSHAHSKSRQLAEIAFSHAQSQFFARSSVQDELNSVALARDEKTRRLRDARLAKEQSDRKATTASLLAKRGRPA